MKPLARWIWRYCLNVLYALDCLGNALVFAGDPRETISSNMGKRRHHSEWADFLADRIDNLFFWQHWHCEANEQHEELKIGSRDLLNDKWLHWLAGAVMALPAFFMPPVPVMGAIVIVAVAKELIWDLLLERGTPDVFDAVTTIVSGAIPVIVLAGRANAP